MPTHGSDVEPIDVVHWCVYTHIRYSDANVMECGAYGYVVDGYDQLRPRVVWPGVLRTITIGNLEILFPKDVNVHTSLRVDFAPYQSRCHELSIQVPDKAGDAFGLKLQALDELQRADDSKTPITALEATEVEMSTRLRLLEDQKMGLAEDNCLPNQIVHFSFDKEHCKACESPGNKAATNAKVELLNVKEVMHALEERASTDRVLMLSTFEYRNSEQVRIGTASTKLHAGEGALRARVDQLNKYSGSARMVEIYLQAQMKSNLQNYRELRTST